MRRLLTVPVSVLCLMFPANPCSAQTFDQKALGRAILKELIETNTTPSIGNTTRAAELIATRFRAAGVPDADIAVIGPDSAHKNLVVRIRGTDRTRRPILLMGHLDVVEAERSDWSIDPFTLTEQNGYYYGRGTQDIKGGVTTFVTALLRMRAERFTPARDLVLALTAGEEGGMPNGIEWLLANHRALIDAEFCINVDGGGIDSEAGKPVAMNMQAAEKVYFDVTLTVKNRGGHSSLPRPDNAINTLARALARIESYTFPAELNEITRTYFERAAPLRGGRLGADLKAAATGLGNAEAVARLSRDPWLNAQMRTTCVATMLSGGHAPNALPQTATANVNCRRLPGLRSDSLLLILTNIVGDTSVVFSITSDSPQSAASPLRADVEQAVRVASEAIGPSLPLLPAMETGATDGLYTRNAGIPTYGLYGIPIDVDDIRAHGRDERIRVVAFEQGQEFAYRLIKTISTPVTP